MQGSFGQRKLLLNLESREWYKFKKRHPKEAGAHGSVSLGGLKWLILSGKRGEKSLKKFKCYSNFTWTKIIEFELDLDLDYENLNSYLISYNVIEFNQTWLT